MNAGRKRQGVYSTTVNRQIEIGGEYSPGGSCGFWRRAEPFQFFRQAYCFLLQGINKTNEQWIQDLLSL
jgi:hypothetical protein